MHKKNIPSNHELSVPKPSSSKLANFAAGAFIAINLLASTPTYSQKQITPDDNKKKNTIEYVKTHDFVKKNTVTIDSLEHQKLITMNIDTLLAKYGTEKGMEIIREHMLIEINAIRQAAGLSKLELDKDLDNVSQNYVKYMIKRKYIGHIDLESHSPGDRAEAQGYVFTIFGENIANGIHTIDAAIQIWKGSKPHMDVILERNNRPGKKFNKIGIGYQNHLFVNSFSD